ncbi:hypothetical protein B7494_g6408 [Chlorociboria aeruginascens]|nr:hypothetical protein B7494_g6408 [Chlorociboria aeruginascens]
MMSFRSFFPRLWINPSDVGRHHETNNNRRQQICGDLDANGFDWQVWAVAGSGFFTDSYNLFATNVILPSLLFVYWDEHSLDESTPNPQWDPQSHNQTKINIITLCGSLVGQLIFGFLADRYGRRKLYGLELVVVIFGTLGLVQCSAGFDGSMTILSWIMFWRFFVGLGIGAEYPLSAVITVEFAPRRSRARMMAAVFLMQPLAQLLASVVGLAVLLTVGRRLPALTTPEQQLEARYYVDKIWRYVVGVGAIPALVAIGFRLTIPESPRYTLDVDNDGARALRDTQIYLNIPRTSIVSARGVGDHGNGAAAGEAGLQPMPRAALDPEAVHEEEDDDSMEIQDLSPAAEPTEQEKEEEEPLPDPFAPSELYHFFWEEGNIRYLLGTSITWFLLDFAFYGLGINNPRVIAQIWSANHISGAEVANTPVWSNPADSDLSIYEVLKQDGIRSIITVSVGSMLGSIILIKAINYLPRKAWLVWSFVGMAALFAVIGGAYFRAANTNLYALTITLYVLCQLLFNLGPNTLTFIIPAEIFPTRYRGTCHGISAAAGKLGSVVVQAFLPSTHIDTDNHSLSWILIGFAFAMALGAVVAWAWIPEVQNVRGSDTERRRGRNSRSHRYEVPNKSLEELASGMKGVKDEAVMVGFRHRSASPWATTTDDLLTLYNCPSTGAVTIRTSLLTPFHHDPSIHQYTFFSPSAGYPTTKPGRDGHTFAHPGETSSLNTLGYSPIPLDSYLATLKLHFEAGTFKPRHPSKPFLVSVTGTSHEVSQCYEKISHLNDTGIPGLKLMMEINLSCPNIPDKPPPAYDEDSLKQYILAIHDAKAQHAFVHVGIKTPPYTHQGQFHTLIQAIEYGETLAEHRVPAIGNPIDFIVATNTLGSCLVLDADNHSPSLDSATGLGVGGMAGSALHPLALGNVKSIRTALDSSVHPGVQAIALVGVGGVGDADGFRRMRSVGAAVVGVGTAFGREGVEVFARIRSLESESPSV